MRIALIGYEANIKNRVGSNQYAFELIKTLYELDNKNQYTVYLPNLPLSDLPKEREGWTYKIVGPSKFWNVFGLPWALFKQQPKPNIVFNPGHYCPLFSPAPLVVSIMDLGYLHFPQHFTRATYWKLKFWTALSIKRAIHLFAISKSTKNDIIKYYGLNSDKITVTYPGYDKDKFKTQNAKRKTEEIKRKYKIKGDYILFLSTLKPSKNIEGLLEAFGIVSRSSDINLVIAGKKGWLFEKIFSKVKELGLEKKVIFTGFVDDEDVPSLMNEAKVFVLLSFWEGFGIPVVEAMACGVPVVVSNAGSLPEIVDKAGIVVDPYNPSDIAKGIVGVMRDKAVWESLRKKGLKRVKQFDWQNCAKKTLWVLEKF